MEPPMPSYLQRLGLVLSLLGFGVHSHAFAAQNDREADHAALRQLRDRVATAINQQDVATLASCFATEFAFTTVDQTVVTSNEQLQTYFDRMFRGPSALVTAMKTEPKADILTRFIDANTGVCYGSAKDTYTMKSGDVVEMNLRWTATVVKENGTWKVALAHAGTDFLANPVLERVKRFTKTVGISAGLAGLIAGVLLGRLLGARAKRSATPA